MRNILQQPVPRASELATYTVKQRLRFFFLNKLGFELEKVASQVKKRRPVCTTMLQWGSCTTFGKKNLRKIGKKEGIKRKKNE